MEHVQQPLSFLATMPAETGMEVLHFPPCQAGEGRLHGGHADAPPHVAHQGDGLVAGSRVAAIARAAQGASLQTVRIPAIMPEGQGAGGQAERRGGFVMRQS